MRRHGALVLAGLVLAASPAPAAELDDQLTLPSARLTLRAPSALVPDPIAQLRVALGRSSVAPALRRRYLREARAARAVARRLGGSRGAELAAVLRSSGVVAARVGLPPPRARAVFLELRINRRLALAGSLPAPGQRLRDGGLVYERYAGQGVRIMPLATWAEAQARRKAGDLDGMRERIDAALAIAVARRGRLQVEYLFPYGTPPPWRSPMASAVAMETTARGFEVTGDERYKAAAHRLHADVMRAGLDEGEDTWYPLYPFAPDVHVLNAHLQVTIALRNSSEALADETLRADFERAFATARRRSPAYDTGGWSLYSEGVDAPLEYHDLMTLQLRQLANFTLDPDVRAVSVRFARYRRERPKAAGPVEPQLGAIYPAPADGFHDLAAFAFTLSKPADVVVVSRPRGLRRTVDVLRLGRLRRGEHTVAMRPSGASGEYVIDVRAVDLAGNDGLDRVARFTVARDTTAPAVESVTLRRGRLRWRVADSETPWLRIVVRRPGRRPVVLERAGLSGSRLLPKRMRTATRVSFADSTGNITRLTL